MRRLSVSCFPRCFFGGGGLIDWGALQWSQELSRSCRIRIRSQSSTSLAAILTTGLVVVRPRRRPGVAHSVASGRRAERRGEDSTRRRYRPKRCSGSSLAVGWEEALGDRSVSFAEQQQNISQNAMTDDLSPLQVSTPAPASSSTSAAAPVSASTNSAAAGRGDDRRRQRRARSRRPASPARSRRCSRSSSYSSCPCSRPSSPGRARRRRGRACASMRPCRRTR